MIAAGRSPAGRAGDARVLVVAEVRMYREGLAAALRAAPGIDVIALAQLPPDLAALDPDIVLYDVSRTGALAAVRGLLDRAPPVKVVAVAISEHERDLLAV